ncbi:hypothetical protein [Sphingorhabdus sp. SMR4y]|uniref:hypothetical protein n=1 Tax=Sphingorhabdus sp. SMR4y TaxID=2584094 RepID=UPI000B6175C6|nr:hypothetical protein [Sphingorhabdus sp. SMR4y]ASK88434.1 hypothetical protein SPHFLASMR4Y_01687 [Sphingorhabdus sp. SMR4y]
MKNRNDNIGNDQATTELKTWEKPKLVVFEVTPATKGKVATFVTEFNASYGVS